MQNSKRFFFHCNFSSFELWIFLFFFHFEAFVYPKFSRYSTQRRQCAKKAMLIYKLYLLTTLWYQYSKFIRYFSCWACKKLYGITCTCCNSTRSSWTIFLLHFLMIKIAMPANIATKTIDDMSTIKIIPKIDTPFTSLLITLISHVVLSSFVSLPNAKLVTADPTNEHNIVTPIAVSIWGIILFYYFYFLSLYVTAFFVALILLLRIFTCVPMILWNLRMLLYMSMIWKQIYEFWFDDFTWLIYGIHKLFLLWYPKDKLCSAVPIKLVGISLLTYPLLMFTDNTLGNDWKKECTQFDMT